MPSSKPFHNLVTIIAIAIAIASLHCIGVVHAQAGGGGFDPNQFGGGNNKMCPPKHCGKGYTAVPKSTSKSGDDNDTTSNALSFESRGCNSLAGGGVSMGGMGMGMGGMGGVDDVIAPCCDLYHACLQICGSTKSFCDSNLEKCMDGKCASLSSGDRKSQCEKDVNVKKLMLSLSQCHDFTRYQNANCECVKSDNNDSNSNSNTATSKRTNVLQSFYDTYVTDKSKRPTPEKIASLMSKATDGKKFAGLIYKLVEKYYVNNKKNMIKRVKDPQQRMMEDLLNRRDGDGGGGESGSTKKKQKQQQEMEDIEEEDDSDERIEL